MKIHSLLLLAVSASALLSADDPLTGKWNVHTNVGGNESEQTCTFTQKDGELTGTCTSDRPTVTISGKIDGKKVTWSYKSDYNGTPLTVIYEGKFEAESKITGSVSVPEFSAEGDFTAAKRKSVDALEQ